MSLSLNRYWVSAFLIVSFALVTGFSQPWDGYSNPEKMSQGRYIYDFDQLPLEGRLTDDRIPWPETYFPSFRGGIAYRWQKKHRDSAWTYRLYTREELMALPAETIAQLSPAEKFDILQGDYTYRTVRYERGRTSPKDARWAGLCHGWSPAAILHKEPQPKTVMNADGITIPFGSSDIKALLIFYYGKVKWTPTSWTGKKCKRKLFGGKGCQGVNAATVHLALANQIGRLNESFIMDRDREVEIWNQPYFAFKSKKMGSCELSRDGVRAGAVRGVRVNTDADFTTELSDSQWEPYLKLDPAIGQVVTKKKTSKFAYCLELNASGRIVGGEWLTETRPGFVWNHEPLDFSDPYYGRVRELLSDEAISTPAD